MHPVEVIEPEIAKKNVADAWKDVPIEHAEIEALTAGALLCHVLLAVTSHEVLD
jgi:hypothetical protein